MKVLALEASTSNIKALLYDNVSGARMTREKHIPGELIRDGALYDPDRLALDMLALGRTVLEESGNVPDIISVSVTWHSLLLCDREMRPQSPVYLWTFRGAHPVTDRIRKDEEKAAALYRRTGAIVHPSYPRYKLEWLRETGISFDGLRIIGLGTYLTWKLTGTVAALPAMAAGSGLYLIKKPEWDKEELEHLGIDPAQLPELSDFHTTFPLGREAAYLLGVPEGIPCALAGPDGGLDQLGADAMEPGIMTVSVGTSGSLRVSTGDTPRTSARPSTWCYRSPVGGWLSGIGTSGATNCVDWAKEKYFPKRSFPEIEKMLCRFVDVSVGPAGPFRVTFGADGQPECITPVRVRADMLEECFEDGPVFLPFLFGSRGPYWEEWRTGGFLGVGDIALDYYYAVLEGVLLNLYQCYEIFSETNGVPHTARLSGGIINSPFWLTMCADVFGMPMELVPEKNSSLLGAAYLGCLALGEEPAVPGSGKARSVIFPDAERHTYYLRRYTRYKTAFRAQKPPLD